MENREKKKGLARLNIDTESIRQSMQPDIKTAEEGPRQLLQSPTKLENPYLQQADEMTDNVAGRTLKSLWKGAGEAAGAVGGAIKENVIDPAVDYVKEGHKNIMAGRPDKTSWDEVVIGATPMLLAALTGDYETGAEFAGKGLLDYEKQKMDAAKAAAKAKGKDSAEKKQLKKMWVGDKEMAVSYNPYDDSLTPTGVVMDTAQQAARRAKMTAQAKGSTIKMYQDKNREITVPYDSANPVEVDKIKRLTKGIGSIANPSQRKYVQKSTSEAMKLDKEAETYRSLTNSLDGIMSDNVTRQKAALKDFVRSTEPGGRLTDYDVSFMMGTFGSTTNLIEEAERWASGHPSMMGPELAKRLAAGIASQMQVKRQGLQDRYDRIIVGGESVGLDAETMKRFAGAPNVLGKQNIVLRPKKAKGDGDDLIIPIDSPQFKKLNKLKDEYEVVGYE
jgi:hypothetical protein